MSVVFLDTVGLLALWDESDQWHAAAEKAFGRIQSEKADLITTTYVLAECGNAAARRPYRQAVVELHEQLLRHRLLIVPTSDDWETAWRGYAQGQSGRAGIVDLLSIAVMRRLNIAQVFTNDHHFSIAGMEILM